MISASQIKPRTPIVCSNDAQLGVVDHVEGNDTIKLSKDANGQHHYIPMNWVTSVDDQVHIDRSGGEAMREWTQTATTTTTNELLWVLGHTIRPFDTSESYGMIEVTSLPHVPGPPPHFHKRETEFFTIIQGTLDVMRDGEWTRCSPGTFVELPPNTAHTFINNTDQEVVWVTGWRPKGFERFFRAFGIPIREPLAQENSVADQVVQNVLRNVERYGMFLAV
jgi:hypothetical protein